MSRRFTANNWLSTDVARPVPGKKHRKENQMSENQRSAVLDKSKEIFTDIVKREGLTDADVSVLAKPLTPEEAIGTPGRRDFPIVIGKERVVESSVLGSRGHAFTDAPREFIGTVKETIDLELNDNPSRAIFVATLNAVMAHLGQAKGTVHCKDEDPEECAVEIARHIRREYGPVKVGLIGLNPAIAERLVDTFGAGNVSICDLAADNIGKERFGVLVENGAEGSDRLIDAADFILLTGTTLVNATFDRLHEKICMANKPFLIYGVTCAGISRLQGIERICPLGRDS